jgi:hypothetical protein
VPVTVSATGVIAHDIIPKTKDPSQAVMRSLRCRKVPTVPWELLSMWTRTAAREAPKSRKRGLASPFRGRPGPRHYPATLLPKRPILSLRLP